MTRKIAQGLLFAVLTTVGCGGIDETALSGSDTEALRRRRPIPEADASCGTGGSQDGGTGGTDGGTGGSTGGCANGQLFAENFESLPLGVGWVDNSQHGAWTCVYNCPGTGIETDGTRVLSEVPPVASSPDQTSGSSILSLQSFGDMDMTVRMKTVQQVRRNSAPNNWEVAWLLWHHIDRWNSYYLVLKPQGWEIGKAIYCEGCPWGNQGQEFLATGGGTFPVGRWYNVRIRQVGPTFSVYVDGVLLTTFTDAKNPLLSGQIGLYNEDSHVHFDDILVCRP